MTASALLFQLPQVAQQLQTSADLLSLSELAQPVRLAIAPDQLVGHLHAEELLQALPGVPVHRQFAAGVEEADEGVSWKIGEVLQGAFEDAVGAAGDDGKPAAEHEAGLREEGREYLGDRLEADVRVLAQPEEDLGDSAFELVVAPVELVVGDHEVEEGREVAPVHDIQQALVLLLELDQLHALQVAVVAGGVLEDVLVAEVGEVGVVVAVAALELPHLLLREQPRHERVVPVLHARQHLLRPQRAMRLHRVAERGEHAGHADVGLPGGQVPQRAHVLVDLEERQRVRLCGLAEERPLEAPLFEEEPEVLLEVLVADAAGGGEQEAVVLLEEVVAEGHGDHAHLLEDVEALQVRHRALRVAQQVALDAVAHLREGLALLQHFLHQRWGTRLSQRARTLAMSCSSLVKRILARESRKVVCSWVRQRKRRRGASRSSIVIITNMIALRVVSRFCGMKYYREIAEFLKIKVPVLNEEIRIAQTRDCVVHGIKKMQEQPSEPLPPEENAQSESESAASVVMQGSSAPVVEPLYIYEKHSQQIVPFHKAFSISKTLDMDLNLVREGSATIYPILAVSTFRKRVYSEYFMAHVKRRGKEGFKSIRIGERIEDNDIRTKIDNIQRLVRNGERRFRLTALNDSERSEKVLVEFGKLFGKEVEPRLSAFRNAKRQLEERWVCELTFEDEVPVNVDQVNKKWRRQQFQKEHSSRDFSQGELEELFNNKDVRIDQEMYMAYREMNLKMPERFDRIARVERELEDDRLAFYRSAQADPQDELQEWDEEEEAKFKEKMQRYNQEYFKERTATEILGEMEELKASGYESQAHKVARFKQLKAELQAILQKHQNQDL